MRYQDRLKSHLVEYKHSVLGLTASGTWARGERVVERAHILPKHLASLNVLPGIREKCWDYIHAPATRVQLHRYFHHLTSSQACCLNLFFPFVGQRGRLLLYLLKVLELPSANAKATFEKVYDEGEGTNLDLSIENETGPIALFEVKLSEDGFGDADKKDLEKYKGKIAKYHHAVLSRNIDPKWLELSGFMQRYQVMRNLSYACRYPDSTLFFVVPKANESLTDAIAELPEICGNDLGKRVRVLYLEELVERLDDATAKIPGMPKHWEDFGQKYLFNLQAKPH